MAQNGQVGHQWCHKHHGPMRFRQAASHTVTVTTDALERIGANHIFPVAKHCSSSVGNLLFSLLSKNTAWRKDFCFSKLKNLLSGKAFRCKLAAEGVMSLLIFFDATDQHLLLSWNLLISVDPQSAWKQAGGLLITSGWSNLWRAVLLHGQKVLRTECLCNLAQVQTAATVH